MNTEEILLEFEESELFKIIFNYFHIETYNKSYWQLIDEVDKRLKNHLNIIYEECGQEHYLDKFKSDRDAQLLQLLLQHLTQIHRWSET